MQRNLGRSMQIFWKYNVWNWISALLVQTEWENEVFKHGLRGTKIHVSYEFHHLGDPDVFNKLLFKKKKKAHISAIHILV